MNFQAEQTRRTHLWTDYFRHCQFWLPRPSTLYLPHSIARREKIRQFQLAAESRWLTYVPLSYF